MKRFFKSFY